MLIRPTLRPPSRPYTLRDYRQIKPDKYFEVKARTDPDLYSEELLAKVRVGPFPNRRVRAHQGCSSLLAVREQYVTESETFHTTCSGSTSRR